MRDESRTHPPHTACPKFSLTGSELGGGCDKPFGGSVRREHGRDAKGGLASQTQFVPLNESYSREQS